MSDYVPVPVERWGRDHWTTLLYAETRGLREALTAIARGER